MRTFGSAVLALAALVLAGIALPGAWIDRNIVQVDGFVELAGPLGADPEFQAELTTALATEVTANAGLPDALSNIVEPLIADAAANVTALPGYPAAWDETLRRSHNLSFPINADLATGVDSPQPLRLDLAPVVALALQEVGSGIGIDVPAPAETLVDIGSPAQQEALSQLKAVSGGWPVLAIGAVVAALTALVLARRRGTALALIGLGSAVLGGLFWAGARTAPEVLERMRAETGTTESSISGLFQDGLVARFTASGEPLALAVVGVGVVLLVSGAAVRLIGGGTRQRMG
ncbi:hypothetical protein [Arthrobacter sp. H20]|uniref:hypothetical protein n=1 Tax=Arthrobacter sp. H20 TaxID=1267981 RepID=UPI00047B3DA0|nr:hypothetical protein [Arthrobacter sp. H20]